MRPANLDCIRDSLHQRIGFSVDVTPDQPRLIRISLDQRSNGIGPNIGGLPLQTEYLSCRHIEPEQPVIRDNIGANLMPDDIQRRQDVARPVKPQCSLKT